MATTPAPSQTVFLPTGTAAGPFATGWNYNAAEDVAAYLELAGVRQPDLTQGVDFTVTGATPSVNGGSVTLDPSVVPEDEWAEGDRLVLYRRTVKRQSLQLPDTEGHKPQATERALDRLMRSAEEGADALADTLRTPVGEGGLTLHPAAARAGKLLAFDDSGKPSVDRSLAAFDADVAQAAEDRVAAAGSASAAASSAGSAAGYAEQTSADREQTGADRAAAALSALNAVLSSEVPIYRAVANAEAAEVPAVIKAVRTQFKAPNYALPATLTGGADYVRTSKAVIDAAGYPAAAYFRSGDRYMPDGTTHATNGGYWLIDTANLDVTKFGAVGDGVTLDDGAINAALQTAKAAGSGNVRAPRGAYLTSATCYVFAQVALILDQGATLKPNGDFDVVRLHAKGHFKGKVDASGVAGFSSALLLLDGADEASAATAFRLHTKTTFDFEGVLSAVATVGIHVHLKATTANARIMGVQGRAKVYGGEYGIKETITATDGSNFITSVDIAFEGSECRRVIDQNFGSGGMYHIDFHRWWGSAQPRTGTTVPMYNVGGQYSTYCLVPWDWNTVAGTAPYGVVIQAGARQSRMVLGIETAYLNVVTTDPTFVIENLLTGLTSSINTGLVRGPSTGNLIFDLPNTTGAQLFRMNGSNAVGISLNRHLELYGFSGNNATIRNFNAAAQSIDLINATGKLPIINAAAPASLTATGAAGQMGVTANSFYVCHATNAWRRYQADGYAAKGDVDATLAVDTDALNQAWKTTLTADRTVTLSTTGAVAGARFRISRPAGGAFNLNVGTGPLKALAAGTWCEVTYNGTAWELTAYGSL